MRTTELEKFHIISRKWHSFLHLSQGNFPFDYY
jgi:hypothetical protein